MLVDLLVSGLPHRWSAYADRWTRDHSRAFLRGGYNRQVI